MNLLYIYSYIYMNVSMYVCICDRVQPSEENITHTMAEKDILCFTWFDGIFSSIFVCFANSILGKVANFILKAARFRYICR